MNLSRGIIVGLLTLAACLLASCRSSSSVEQTERLTPIGPGRVTPEQIQSEVMAFTDTYFAVVGRAVDQISLECVTPHERRAAHRLKANSLQSSLSIASNGNPIVALLDMAVMVSLQVRWTEDDDLPPEVAFLAGHMSGLHAALASLEDEIWETVEKALTEQQRETLGVVIDQMWTEYRDLANISWIRASEFAEERQRTILSTKGGGNLLQLFYLDPLAGLSPAARELAQSRLLAERAFFYVRWLPNIANWQVTDVIYGTAAMPETEAAVSAAERASLAAERAAATAERLPEVVERERVAAIEQLSDEVTRERHAAIEQVFDNVSREREAIISRLEENEQQMTALLTELRTTVEASTTLSDSADVTLASAKALADAVIELKGPPDPDKRPFDITEYQATVDSATRTVEELNTLAASLERVLASPAIADGGEHLGAAGAYAHGLIDRVFWRALIVVGAALAGILGVGLILRRTGRPA